MLIDKVPEILKYIESNQDYLTFNETIFNILEGDLIRYVDAALKSQLISNQAYESARESISPINIPKKVTDKLTKLYASNVKRTVTVNNEPSKKDQEVIEWYVEKLKINKHMNDFNYFMNSTKTGLIEPYIDSEGNPKARSIPSHQFLVWSDDPIEPNKPTVLIKLMGKKKFGDNELNVYFLYSKSEFIAINEDGEIVESYMQDNEGLNVYNVIPATYGSMSDYLLLPIPDRDLLKIATLFPLAFTHNNEAIKYMSYSIVYGVDVDSENLERNPNVFWYFKSDEGRTPVIGQIKPEVDTTKVIENIMTQLDLWLETKGIKTSNAGKARSDNALAGVSLMIKEMDTLQSLKTQMSKMEEIENKFWKMMAKVHNYWVANGIVKGLPQMNENISLRVEYELPKPIESEDERLERAIKAKSSLLASTMEALRIWKPKLNDKEIEKLIGELEIEYSSNFLDKDDDDQEGSQNDDLKDDETES